MYSTYAFNTGIMYIVLVTTLYVLGPANFFYIDNFEDVHIFFFHVDTEVTKYLSPTFLVLQEFKNYRYN